MTDISFKLKMVIKFYPLLYSVQSNLIVCPPDFIFELHFWPADIILLIKKMS